MLDHSDIQFAEPLGNFSSKFLVSASGSESGMDDLFLKRVLFEWLRDRSCWVEAYREAQRKNRRMPKLHLKKKF
jgi:hypothetical protein